MIYILFYHQVHIQLCNNEHNVLITDFNLTYFAVAVDSALVYVGKCWRHFGSTYCLHLQSGSKWAGPRVYIGFMQTLTLIHTTYLDSEDGNGMYLRNVSNTVPVHTMQRPKSKININVLIAVI